MTDTKVWIINKSDKDFERVDIDLGKHIVLKPYRPIQLPLQIGLRYMRFNTIVLCENPEQYFENEPLKRLIIRDAGIGDLLLLEPVLRQIHKNENAELTVLTRFPEVYHNNPAVKDLIHMNSKAELPKGLKVSTWDNYEDLRSYSETCENRNTKHRTDCYNQVFQLPVIEDKEPRIYFGSKDKPVIKKKEGYNYIGVACDGSHFFRRYNRAVELIHYILDKDPKNIVVVIGDGWEDGQGFVKIKKHRRIIDLQGKTTIRQVFNLIKDMDYLIAVDTGLMHVGLALHVPTVCIFSIIDPKLRIDYYTGQREIIYKSDLDCIGCGSWHMAKCKYGDIKKDLKFIPPCLEIEPYFIYETMIRMHKEDSIRTFKDEPKIDKPKINIISKNKLTMPIIVLNEERNLPRFIELVMKHPAIGKVIAVDGGSDDKTVDLLRKAGAEVYVHYYDKDYHDMQALQRNISFSFVKDNEKCIMMDIDECFSDELSNYLPVLTESNIEYAVLSRRTFKYFDDIDQPTKQIKDYPDWQPRFFTWHRRFKWVGSPHHNIYNTAYPVKIKKDIIHFECEGKDRDALEAKWSIMESKTKEIYT